MALESYNKKRDFKKTPEPRGKKVARKGGLRFVIQKHDASHLHYDLRLEMEGVMKSWAVPKGPSLDPEVKRLAMMVEDHPISYNTFEGTIPKGEYGAGEVIVWDTGTYHAEDTDDPKQSEREVLAGLEKGHFNFFLEGEKLRGIFSLVQMKGPGKYGNNTGNQWMLIKSRDEYASEEVDPTDDNQSVLSDRILIGRNEKMKPDSTYLEAELPSKKKSRKTIAIPRVKPMLATLAAGPFDGADWLFEIKWDGYRALAHVEGGRVDLYSRNFQSFNEKFAPVVAELRKVKEQVLFDGEVIAHDKEGKVSFQELQNVDSNETKLEYVVFDLLFLEGEDLRELPLVERKTRLAKLLKKYPRLTYSEHVLERGKLFFQEAKKKDLEGIMAKKSDSPYRTGVRSDEWRKIKNIQTDEAIIAGFTKGRGSRKFFGALVLGQYEGDVLKFIGHTGTGFNESVLEDTFDKLKPLIRERSPFKEKVPINAPVTWVEPKLVAEIKFTEKTASGTMRHPVFLGLREDKRPEEVTPERPVEMKNLRVAKRAPKKNNGDMENGFTNLDKVLFPELGLTKGDLIGYYDKVSEYILPYLKDRAENMNRHPNGIHAKNFYQKNVTYEVPKFASTWKHFSESNEEDVNYLVCNNKETLLYMANLACIELNPWTSRTKKPENPDFMIIDLDPGENTFEQVIKVAQETKKVLDLSCEKSYVKTSGKSGIHICIPLGAKYTYETIRSFAEILVRMVHQRLPDITSIERSPAKRKKLIYLDYLQNGMGQTIAAPYSMRPTPEATVSTPLKWSEVKKGLDPKKFTYKTILPRLKKEGDLWSGILKESVDLKAAIKCLEGEMK